MEIGKAETPLLLEFLARIKGPEFDRLMDAGCFRLARGTAAGQLGLGREEDRGWGSRRCE